jgi:hypothetical protein
MKPWYSIKFELGRYQLCRYYDEATDTCHGWFIAKRVRGAIRILWSTKEDV